MPPPRSLRGICSSYSSSSFRVIFGLAEEGEKEEEEEEDAASSPSPRAEDEDANDLVVVQRPFASAPNRV